MRARIGKIIFIFLLLLMVQAPSRLDFGLRGTGTFLGTPFQKASGVDGAEIEENNKEKEGGGRWRRGRKTTTKKHLKLPSSI